MCSKAMQEYSVIVGYHTPEAYVALYEQGLDVIVELHAAARGDLLVGQSHKACKDGEVVKVGTRYGMQAIELLCSNEQHVLAK